MVEHPTADEMDDALTAAHEHLSATDGEYRTSLGVGGVTVSVDGRDAWAEISVDARGDDPTYTGHVVVNRTEETVTGDRIDGLLETVGERLDIDFDLETFAANSGGA